MHQVQAAEPGHCGMARGGHPPGVGRLKKGERVGGPARIYS
ncbi:hypothetical protein [Streptomyces sp. NPDC051132]